MTAWLRPTLARRVLIALGMAFLLVWSMLLAYEYIRFRQETHKHSGVHKVGTALYAALVKLDRPDQVKAAVATTALWLNQVRRDANTLPGDLVFELRDHQGGLLYSSGGSGSGDAFWIYQRAAADSTACVMARLAGACSCACAVTTGS